MQLWPRSGAERLPEANGDNKIARVSEIFSLCVCSVAVMKSRKKIFPVYDREVLRSERSQRFSRSGLRKLLRTFVRSLCFACFSLQEIFACPRLFEKWSSSDYFVVANGGTLSHGLRQELFDYLVHGRRPSDKRAGLCRNLAHQHLKFKKASLM